MGVLSFLSLFYICLIVGGDSMGFCFEFLLWVFSIFWYFVFIVYIFCFDLLWEVFKVIYGFFFVSFHGDLFSIFELRIHLLGDFVSIFYVFDFDFDSFFVFML